MSLYFYDLETSGINAKAQRIMQFAGQRVNDNLEPITEPDNWLVKLTDEVLPNPEAILITGITPQKTLEEGYTEAEFLKLFMEKVNQPDTCVVGFNNVRFDDEFMRNTLWRNFYDPYEWQWRNNNSRWDLLDVVRMVRALRPEGIRWPVDDKGQPTNRLELMTKLNDIEHEDAHDALADVRATIAVAKLIKTKQPKMYDFLFKIRNKKAVAELIDVSNPKPFVYTSGRYSNNWQKTTVVVPIGIAEHGSVIVYDLRQAPKELTKLSDDQLSEKALQRNKDTDILPIKLLKVNTCPAVAPLGVFDGACQERLSLAMATIEENFQKLFAGGLAQRLADLFNKYQDERQKSYNDYQDPDFQIYNGFLSDSDRNKSTKVISHGVEFYYDFSDSRLEVLFSRYKARNFPKSLSEEELNNWRSFKTQRLTEGVPGQINISDYIAQLAELSKIKTSDNEQYLLQELQLWVSSLLD